MNIIIMLDEGLLGHPMCPPLSVGCSVMEMKVDTLTDNVSIGLQNREDSAQQIKRYLLGWTCGCVTAWINLCVYVLLNCAGCSLIEEKVDQVAAELTKRQLEREDTALQYKRYLPSWA